MQNIGGIDWSTQAAQPQNPRGDLINKCKAPQTTSKSHFNNMSDRRIIEKYFDKTNSK